MNLMYGGRSLSLDNAHFINGELDPFSVLGAENAVVVREKGRLNLSNVEVAFRKRELSKDNGYCSVFLQHPDCQNGCNYTFGKNWICKCGVNWGGERCDRIVHNQATFRAVAVSSVVIPTILLFIIALSIWVGGNWEGDDLNSYSTPQYY
jgi:hypothetical protein